MKQNFKMNEQNSRAQCIGKNIEGWNNVRHSAI